MYAEQYILPASTPILGTELLYGETTHKVERFFYSKRKLLDSCAISTNGHLVGRSSVYWEYCLYPAFISMKYAGSSIIRVN